MIITAEIRIHAPLHRVWDVFADIGSWREWNPVCRECRFETGEALARGACISFSLNPLVLPIRIAPEVTLCRPMEKVVWKGGRFGVNAEHEFLFMDKGDGVDLVSREFFKGPMLPVARLMGLPSRLHVLTLRLLEAIKKRAEAGGADG